MIFVKPRKILSGFHAGHPDPDVPELVHVGEQWVPADYVISPHTHAVWEFYLQLDGWSLWRDVRGESYRCPAGAFYAPPPGLKHWLERSSKGRHHFLFAAIDVEAVVHARLPMLVPTWATNRVAYVSCGSTCEATFRHLIQETVAARPFRAAGLRAAIDALVIDASRMLHGKAAATGRTLVPSHAGVDAVRHALDAHPDQAWRLTDLGRLSGLSPNHLVTKFTNELGVSPHQYLLKRRIDRAKHMLANTDVPITSLALELGFSSSQHFARTFKQACRTSASVYRRRHRQKRV